MENTLDISDQLIARIVVLMKPEERQAYKEMCAAIGEKEGPHIRAMLATEMELYKANKKEE
jgi:hypothetical protein